MPPKKAAAKKAAKPAAKGITMCRPLKSMACCSGFVVSVSACCLHSLSGCKFLCVAEPELPEYMALGTSGSEDDSESEEGEDAEEENDAEAGGNAPEKPEVDAKTMKKVKQQIAKAKESGERGVVYLGNIPFGFYEEEMKAFFNQFGTVLRLRMSRSKKTGRSRGYAFIEFQHKEVADIVAETMNNYLMFNRLLKCQVIPAERVHEETFKNAHRAFRHMNWRKFEQRRHNKPRNAEQTEQVVKRLVSKEKKTRAKLEKLGIEYDFPGYVCKCGHGGLLGGTLIGASR